MGADGSLTEAEEEVTDENDALDLQMTRGFLHTHARLSENFANLFEVSGAALALAEVLVEKGILDREELNDRILQIRDKLAGTRYGSGTGFIITMNREDKYAPEQSVEVDCEKRWHLCKAACCTLGIAVSRQDLEEGIVKWDAGEPYLIRRKESGHCCHIQTDNRCGIHENRPLVCRRYSCAIDNRVWLDFENYLPNTESIEQLLTKKNAGRLLELEIDEDAE